jgi:membrane protein
MIVDKIQNFRYLDKQIKRFIKKLKRISIPGFEKVPAYDVIIFFFNGIMKGSLNLRATAIAFNFMLALGPALIFFLAILPYLPINNFQFLLEEFLYGIIPEKSFIAIEPILDDIFKHRGGLPIFGLLTSLFFAQKGVNGIIDAFNATYHTLELRTWYRQRIASIVLLFIYLGIAALTCVLFIASKELVTTIVSSGNRHIEPIVIITGKWLMIILLTFFSISFMYYLGPSRRIKWKFFSAGSTLATILTILASLGFSYFMDHFAQLNKFFGTVGAFIALMLWMNFNALTLLIGFELNASINNAQYKLYLKEDRPV